MFCSDFPLGSCPAGHPFSWPCLRIIPTSEQSRQTDARAACPGAHVQRVEQFKCAGHWNPSARGLSSSSPWSGFGLGSWRKPEHPGIPRGVEEGQAWEVKPYTPHRLRRAGGREDGAGFGLPHTSGWMEPKDSKDLKYEDFFLFRQKPKTYMSRYVGLQKSQGKEFSSSPQSADLFQNIIWYFSRGMDIKIYVTSFFTIHNEVRLWPQVNELRSNGGGKHGPGAYLAWDTWVTAKRAKALP